MYVDTHVHLYLDAFEADRDAVVERARDLGVDRMLLPAVDVDSIALALELSDRYAGVWAMAGLHPTYLEADNRLSLRAVERALEDERVLAVGETGLDYYWSRDLEAEQRDALRRHAELALEYDLPIVLHNRDVKGSEDSSRDIVSVLCDIGDSFKGVFHCFGGPEWLAQEALGLGFHVGLGGTLTFKNGGVPEAIEDVPLSRIVLETDGPYLAPSPHRGTRNEPAYVPLVAQRLAELRGLEVEEVARATTAAAEQLFAIPTL
ncbi:TatD family hydrolase [Rubrivirga sp.]|uniref:TatD family hydrolase n=1 Tax=Rubrivirga sp. TaxID=1885344 RepID=UPI003C767883